VSTICKIEPSVRKARFDRKGMLRAMRMRFANAGDGSADLYLAMHLALDKLRRDPARDGAAKVRIYRQILDEYMLNVSKLTKAVTATTEESPT
jgi:hypothetical protein